MPMVKKASDFFLPGEGLVNQHTGSQSAHTISHATCYIFSTWLLGTWKEEYLGTQGPKALQWGRGTSRDTKFKMCNSARPETASVLHDF